VKNPSPIVFLLWLRHWNQWYDIAFIIISRFLSGSRDGTARIWYFHRSAWKHSLVDVSKRLPKYVTQKQMLALSVY